MGVSPGTACVLYHLLGELIKAFTEEWSLHFMIVLITTTLGSEHR